MIVISYNVATYSPDYIITIMVEIGFKYSVGNIYTHAYLRNSQIWLVQSPNGHHH